MTTTVYDDKGIERRVTVAEDEGIRPNTTLEGLAKLKPAFKEGGSTTAGKTGLGEGCGRGPVHAGWSLGAWRSSAPWTQKG